MMSLMIKVLDLWQENERLRERDPLRWVGCDLGDREVRSLRSNGRVFLMEDCSRYMMPDVFNDASEITLGRVGTGQHSS